MNVTEAEEGEPGMPGLLSLFAEITHLGFGAAVVFIVEIPVGRKHLAVIEIYQTARRSVHREFCPAGDFLAEIHHRFPGGSMDDFLRADPFEVFCRWLSDF